MTRKRKSNERGASLVEYALLIALLAVMAIPSIQHFTNASACKNLRVSYELGGGVGSGSDLPAEFWQLYSKYSCDF